MKTKNQTPSKKIAFLAMLFASFYCFKMSAQISVPYSIANQTGCTAVIQWSVRDISGCSACDSGNMTIPPNTTQQIFSFGGGCSNSNQGCDIDIKLVSIGSTNYGTIYNSTNTTPGTANSITSCSCPCDNGSPVVIWDYAIFTIQP